jgi:ribonuclease G
MTKEIFINCTSLETRVALVEDTILQQVHIDREETPSLVGNIYKAKVLRVMPGMQAAFVDIGVARNAFIHIDDIHSANSNDKIADILRDGQDLVVQVMKDPVKKKGALLTTDISIATDYLVYRHTRPKPGISVKIKSNSERTRLNDLLRSIVCAIKLPDSLVGDFIIRSAAEGISETQLSKDLAVLITIWQSIDSLRMNKSPVSLYQELQKKQHLVTGMLGLGIQTITSDSSDILEVLELWCNQNTRFEKPLFKLHQYQQNLFDNYQIEDQINEALKSNVSLNCGGILVIEETEALSVIDVNTGAFLGETIDQNTFLSVNLEAAIESARQIILRNLSGIIIIDFIDMKKADHRHQVFQRLKQAFSQDNMKATILDFTELGLIQIARKRTSRSLSQVLGSTCRHCEGEKVVKSDETLCFDIFRQLLNIESKGKWSVIEIHASATVVEKINNKFSKALNQLQVRAGCDVKLCVEGSIPSDQFKIIPAQQRR